MQLLMCPPSYYGIEYEINPWMKRSRQSDAGLAMRQWSELHRVLAEKLPAEIHLIDAKPGLPDMVFTANAGVVNTMSGSGDTRSFTCLRTTTLRAKETSCAAASHGSRVTTFAPT